jgi:fermentation-respiration switch protein FrsA (DUF1100 family)
VVNGTIEDEVDLAARSANLPRGDVRVNHAAGFKNEARSGSMGSFLLDGVGMRLDRKSNEFPGIKSSRDIPGGRRIAIELAAAERERVPGVVLVPDAARPEIVRWPAALLLHGFSSRKERMAEGIGRALLARGVASLAIDLPLHGAREGSVEHLSFRNPLQLIGAWRLALAEARLSLDYLSALAMIDPQRLALVGYSLGAYLAVVVAANDARVRAIVLASGGDLPEQTPFAAIVRAAADPLRAVRKLAGRPLLMVNGRYDRTIRAEQAERLYAAAGEPKQLHWYQGGHWPPAGAIEFGADWLASRLTGDRSRAVGRA